MITQSWGIRVYGVPAPKGSMKSIGKGRMVDQLKTTGPWGDKIAAAARSIIPEHADDWQPVEVECTFSVPRPASHYTPVGRALRAGKPVYPAAHGSGDIDKLARNVLDALQAAKVLVNDAQVIRLTCTKYYEWLDLKGEPDTQPDQLKRPGAVIRIHPYP